MHNPLNTIKLKYIFVFLFILTGLSIQGQDICLLQGVWRNESIPKGKAVIYGNFKRRLGHGIGNHEQQILLMNVTTQRVYGLIVNKSSSKERPFCAFINPGTYIILEYHWRSNKIYDGIFRKEPIYKGIDMNDGNTKLKVSKGKIPPEKLHSFSFIVTPGSILYLGTWNFDTGLASFTDEKEATDQKIQRKYKKLNFSEAETYIPE